MVRFAASKQDEIPPLRDQTVSAFKHRALRGKKRLASSVFDASHFSPHLAPNRGVGLAMRLALPAGLMTVADPGRNMLPGSIESPAHPTAIALKVLALAHPILRDPSGFGTLKH
jgi:hypothetical protein